MRKLVVNVIKNPTLIEVQSYQQIQNDQTFSPKRLHNNPKKSTLTDIY